ncbi:hypothetical protein [Paraprevotella clara]|uniref:hypothetical protein n=1 Tax=Paraprevotella clara TaxID=454154 RepID=UPI00265CE065|nr:hypothetical protein [Paraprevotella clara]
MGTQFQTGGSIKEDLFSYAIGQDLSGRTRLHANFATENDMTTSIRSNREKDEVKQSSQRD